MRTLTRYALMELLKVFVIAVTGLTNLMLIVGLARELLMTQGFPVARVLQLVPYLLPEALCAAIPVTLLLAATTVYARMSGANEIVAIKALGISPLVLLAPAYALAFLLSLATCFFYDWGAWWGKPGMQQVVADALQDIVYGLLRTHHTYSWPGRFTIHVKQVQENDLLGVTIKAEGTDRMPGMLMTAQRAQLRIDARQNVLSITAYRGTVDVKGRMTFEFPETYHQEISLPSTRPPADEIPKASSLAVAEIGDKIQLQRQRIREYEQELATRVAWQVLSGDLGQMLTPVWPLHYLEQLKEKQKDLHRLDTEPYRRYATGFSCFFFIWVGAPLAIRLRNSDFLTSFFLCFLPILIVYYPMLLSVVDTAKQGNIPPWSVWAGNVLLGIWGAWLLRRVIRF